MCCSFGSLKNKEVINVRDGASLGCIYDAEINTRTGAILRLVLPGAGLGGYFSAKKRLYIPWDQVERIGDDVILVRLAELPRGSEEHPKRRK